MRILTNPAPTVEPEAPPVAPTAPEPEVAAAKATLDALPAEWVREDFTATILRQARLQAATRKLGAATAAAEGAVAVAVAVAVAAIEAGEDPDEAIAAMVGAKAALSRLEAARGLVPPAIADPALVAGTLASVAVVLHQSAPAAPAPLDYFDQMDQWRNWSRSTRVPVDAPVATDADRAAEVTFKAALARVNTWRAGLAAWAQAHAGGNSEPLSLLGAAAQYVAQAAEVSAATAAADEQTSAANAHRTAAGLTWSVPR